MSAIRTGVLAQLLAPPNPAHRQHAGEIHFVGRQCPRDPTHWHMDPPVIHCGLDLQWTAPYLRVIDNPGDDATDESAAWLPPVPTQRKEPHHV
jgi:hypothetical protein